MPTFRAFPRPPGQRKRGLSRSLFSLEHGNPATSSRRKHLDSVFRTVSSLGILDYQGEDRLIVPDRAIAHSWFEFGVQKNVCCMGEGAMKLRGLSFHLISNLWARVFTQLKSRSGLSDQLY